MLLSFSFLDFSPLKKHSKYSLIPALSRDLPPIEVGPPQQRREKPHVDTSKDEKYRNPFQKVE